MKRSSNDREIDHSLTMASCLMLLSRSGKDSSLLINPSPIFEDMNSTSPNRVFECKTCNRQFPSFQALGGHRASHKKPRLTAGGDVSLETQYPPAKPKSHECSICGLEFAIGQALGGHMRRHRATLNDQSNFQDPNKYSPSDRPSDDHQQIGRPIVKKSNSRRVLCLDLNLTPFENDLELFKLRKPGPMVTAYFR